MKFRLTHIILTLCLFVLSLVPVPPTIAQNTSATPIEIEGAVEAINGTTITVGDLSVDVSSIDASIVSQLTVGTTISISGTLDNVINNVHGRATITRPFHLYQNGVP